LAATTSAVILPAPSHDSQVALPTLSAAQGTRSPLSSQTPYKTGNQKTRSLAQPLGPNWLAQKATADHDREKAEDVKAKRLQIDYELKRTVEFIIYSEVCYKSLSSFVSILKTCLA
jgi:hypothetical protein